MLFEEEDAYYTAVQKYTHQNPYKAGTDDTDKLAKEYIKATIGIEKWEDVKSLNKGKKKELILKSMGANISSRQLNRMTGISRGIINRTKKQSH